MRDDRPWGHFEVLSDEPDHKVKRIVIRPGHRLSLQYHKKKDESLYLYEGKVRIEIEGSDGRLVQYVAEPGHCLRVLPLTKHRLEAIEDATLFEVSTPELEDVQRLKDDYGRV